MNVDQTLPLNLQYDALPELSTLILKLKIQKEVIANAVNVDQALPLNLQYDDLPELSTLILKLKIHK